jgi:hypothetical protein
MYTNLVGLQWVMFIARYAGHSLWAVSPTAGDLRYTANRSTWRGQSVGYYLALAVCRPFLLPLRAGRGSASSRFGRSSSYHSYRTRFDRPTRDRPHHLDSRCVSRGDDLVPDERFPHRWLASIVSAHRGRHPDSSLVIQRSFWDIYRNFVSIHRNSVRFHRDGAVLRFRGFIQQIAERESHHHVRVR